MNVLIRPNYKPEIDVLRAFSIIAVIIYHSNITILGFKIFPGGFIGVDIFFVISGYLISKILFKEIEKKGKINLSLFYEKRIRRIFPLYFFIIVIFSLLGFFFLLPLDLNYLINSAIYSLFFVSNFFFAFTGTQYGDVEYLFKPLIHTWSLSVEEQFYIFYPLFFLLWFKYFKKKIILFFILFTASIFISSLVSNSFSVFSYYMFFTRIWEFLLGTIVAKFEDKNYYKNINANLITFFGSLLILLSFIFFNKNIVHPSIFTLIPLIGTCVIILYSGKSSYFKFLFFNKFIIFFGLISYSLYLWHFPIMSFFRSISPPDSFFHKSLIFLLIIVLSILTYHYIEKPFRNRNVIKRKLLYKIIISLILVFLILIFFLKKNNFNREIHPIFKFNITPLYNQIYQDGENCFQRKKNFCFIKGSTDKVTVYLMGSSYMGSLQKDFINYAKINKINLVLMTGNQCIFDNSIKNSLIICDIHYYEHDQKIKDKKEIIINLLKNNNKVILSYPLPPAAGYLPRILYSQLPFNINEAYLLLKKNPYLITTDYQIFLDRIQFINRLNSDLSFYNNFYSFYPHKIFCNTKILNKCLNHDERNLYYIDGGHPSEFAAEMISGKMLIFLKNIIK